MEIKSKVIYISGPITGRISGNRPMFRMAKNWLQARGAIALDPATLPDGLHSHQAYMNICIPMLREADAILLLPDWEQSVGAMMEYDEASKLGIPIYQFQPILDGEVKLLEG